MNQHKDFTFFTGSRYSGSYYAPKHSMEGFGTYTFPDGSEYRGYFNNGKFNGFGVLKLAPPNKFIFHGIFRNGDLVEIEKMFFGDGLSFNCEIKDNKIDCSNWNYCNAEDRRYSVEIRNEIEPIGPNAYLTRQRPSREIPLNAFDTEEGIFKPSTSFLMDIPAPFYKNRFVACKTERDWILKNCRYGPRHIDDFEMVEPPNLKVWKRILENNINTNLDAVGAEHKCECHRHKERELLLKQLKETKRGEIDADTISTASRPYSPSESSCSSMKENSVEAPLVDVSLCDLARFKWIQPFENDLPKTRNSDEMRMPSMGYD